MPCWLSAAHVPARGTSSLETCSLAYVAQPCSAKSPRRCRVLVPCCCRGPRTCRRSSPGARAVLSGTSSCPVCRPNQLHQYRCPPSPQVELAETWGGLQADGWGWDLWSCYGSFLGASQEGKPRSTLPHVVWGQPLQPLANAPG